MLSRRLTSSRLLQRGAAFFCAALCAVGCQKKPANVPPPPRRAFVRLETLIARHPLQAEVARLRQLEQEVRASAQTTPAQSAATYRLSSLPSDPAVRNTALAAARERSAAQLDELRRISELEIAAFVSDYARRRQQLVQQRREELTAALKAQYAEAERLKREEIYQQIIAALSLAPNGLSILDNRWSLTENKTVVRARRSIYQQQLRSTEFPLVVQDNKGNPVVDESADEILESQINQLEANPGAPKVSMRARIEYRDRIQQQKLIAVNDRIRRIKEEGEDLFLAASTDAQKRIEREVDRQLTASGNPPDFLNQIREQRQAITNIREQEQASIQVVRTIERGSATGPVEIPALFGGAAPETVMAQSAVRAAERIERQRQALEGAIQQAVQAAVRDAAQQRNINVIFVWDSRAGQNGATPDIAGRTNLTDEFARWIQPGTL